MEGVQGILAMSPLPPPPPEQAKKVDIFFPPRLPTIYLPLRNTAHSAFHPTEALLRKLRDREERFPTNTIPFSPRTVQSAGENGDSPLHASIDLTNEENSLSKDVETPPQMEAREEFSASPDTATPMETSSSSSPSAEEDSISQSTEKMSDDKPADDNETGGDDKGANGKEASAPDLTEKSEGEEDLANDPAPASRDKGKEKEVPETESEKPEQEQKNEEKSKREREGQLNIQKLVSQFLVFASSSATSSSSSAHIRTLQLSPALGSIHSSILARQNQRNHNSNNNSNNSNHVDKSRPVPEMIVVDDDDDESEDEYLDDEDGEDCYEDEDSLTGDSQGKENSRSEDPDSQSSKRKREGAYYRISSLDDKSEESAKRRRRRRLASEIKRNFHCQYSRCNKSYGTQGALDQHVRKKHPELPMKYPYPYHGIIPPLAIPLMPFASGMGSGLIGIQPYPIAPLPPEQVSKPDIQPPTSPFVPVPSAIPVKPRPPTEKILTQVSVTPTGKEPPAPLNMISSFLLKDKDAAVKPRRKQTKKPSRKRPPKKKKTEQFSSAAKEIPSSPQPRTVVGESPAPTEPGKAKDSPQREEQH